jgi:hypothetical protein
MIARNNLDNDPRALIGTRKHDRVVKEYYADTGLVQTMARLAQYVAAQRLDSVRA